YVPAWLIDASAAQSPRCGAPIDAVVKPLSTTVLPWTTSQLTVASKTTAVPVRWTGLATPVTVAPGSGAFTTMKGLPSANSPVSYTSLECAGPDAEGADDDDTDGDEAGDDSLAVGLELFDDAGPAPVWSSPSLGTNTIAAMTAATAAAATSGHTQR